MWVKLYCCLIGITSSLSQCQWISFPVSESVIQKYYFYSTSVIFDTYSQSNYCELHRYPMIYHNSNVFVHGYKRAQSNRPVYRKRRRRKTIIMCDVLDIVCFLIINFLCHKLIMNHLKIFKCVWYIYNAYTDMC